MARKTPAHAQLFRLINFLHPVDPVMARDARNTPRHVSTVVEVSIIRQVMNLDPLDGLTRLGTLPNGQELGAVGVNRRRLHLTGRIFSTVTVQAGRRRRNRGKRRFLDRSVAISAIHLEVAGMQLVAERDRLRRLVTDVHRVRNRPEPKDGNSID